MTRPLLRPGDGVGVVAPGFGVRSRLLRAGVERLRRFGFRVTVGRHTLERDGYLAGTDDQRLTDLNDMLADPGLRAIWFARGGYGSARLLEGVRWRALRRSPKLLIGYSDNTAIFSAALRVPGQLCLYGPVVSELGDSSSFHLGSLRAALRGQPVELPLSPRRVLCAGRARGRLVGGNLTVLCHLMGTRFWPDLRDSILLLEDVGEPVYRLDRMLHQLRLSGRLSGLKGVVIGSFQPLVRRGWWLRDRTVDQLLTETFADLRIPVSTGLPIGHSARKRTVPLGGLASLDTRAGRLRLEFRRARGAR